MVKSADARTTNYTNKNVPKVTVLRMKSMLRAGLLNPSKPNTVCAQKDLDALNVIEGYNAEHPLTLRQRQNAFIAFREIYYTFYQTHQEVYKVTH